MAKVYCIYIHRNKINNKIYVGQSCNIAARWHPISYKTSSYFYKAIQKYGWSNFEHIIIENNLTQEEANEKEKYYIKKYNTLNHKYGYNLKDGGKNFLLTKAVKEKIRISNKQYCTSHPEEVSKKVKVMNESARKQVICLNNNMIFNSETLAAKYAGLKCCTPISRCCSGERQTAGKHPTTGERLRWKFLYDEKENKNE